MSHITLTVSSQHLLVLTCTDGGAVMGIVLPGRAYVQDERYIAIEHMDVRRDCVSFAHRVIRSAVQN